MNGAVGFFLQPRFAFCKNGLEKAGKHFSFAKIILLKTESGSFAMQNLRFYRAKQPLLERKTIGFAIR